MWKKIGTIDGHKSNDSRSSRSKDEVYHQKPFPQIIKAKMTEQQNSFQDNDYFFSNFMQKVKQSNGSKAGSQYKSEQGRLQRVLSCKAFSKDYMPVNNLKKVLNSTQTQQLNKKLINNNLQDTQETKYKTSNPYNNAQINISTSTSIDNGVKRLSQSKSTPQIHFERENQKTMFNKKTQEIKNNLKTLKHEHNEVRQAVQSQLSSFNKDFKSMQNQIKHYLFKITEISQKKHCTMTDSKNKNQQELKLNSLNAKKFEYEATKFNDALKSINHKKAQLLEKYKSFRVE